MNPQKVLDLRAAPNVQERLEDLILQEKNGPLSKSDKDELDHYLVLERLIRLSKAHAIQKLGSK